MGQWGCHVLSLQRATTKGLESRNLSDPKRVYCISTFLGHLEQKNHKKILQSSNLNCNPQMFFISIQCKFWFKRVYREKKSSFYWSFSLLTLVKFSPLCPVAKLVLKMRLLNEVAFSKKLPWLSNAHWNCAWQRDFLERSWFFEIGPQRYRSNT